MEHVARKQARIANSTFLRIDTSVAFANDVLFCSDVANKAGARMLTFNQAVEELDFEVIALARRGWLEVDLFERKRRACKYEILVPRPIPVSLIRGV